MTPTPDTHPLLRAAHFPQRNLPLQHPPLPPQRGTVVERDHVRLHDAHSPRRDCHNLPVLHSIYRLLHWPVLFALVSLLIL